MPNYFGRAPTRSDRLLLQRGRSANEHQREASPTVYRRIADWGVGLGRTLLPRLLRRSIERETLLVLVLTASVVSRAAFGFVLQANQCDADIQAVWALAIVRGTTPALQLA